MKVLQIRYENQLEWHNTLYKKPGGVTEYATDKIARFVTFKEAKKRTKEYEKMLKKEEENKGFLQRILGL